MLAYNCNLIFGIFTMQYISNFNNKAFILNACNFIKTNFSCLLPSIDCEAIFNKKLVMLINTNAKTTNYMFG